MRLDYPFIVGFSMLALGLTACSNSSVQPSLQKPLEEVRSSNTHAQVTQQPVVLQPQTNQKTQSVPSLNSDQKHSTQGTDIRFVAVGDVMPGTDFPFNRLPANNGRPVFAGVRDVLIDADVTFGNFEGTLLDGGQPVKSCQNPSVCFLFRTPTAYADTLKWAGFTVMSLANNHAADFGEAGRTSTMKSLDRVGIKHAGREGDIATLQVKGKNIAVIAFAPNRGNYSINDIPQAKQLVAKLKAKNDLVVVSFHGGAEGANYTHVKRGSELFHGENRGDVIAFSHQVIDSGADLVIGHGRHVPRALELYKGKLIAYSLGNFATYEGINVKGVTGLAPILQVTLNDQGDFKVGRIVSASQQAKHVPELDTQQQAFKLIEQLTKEDFAGGNLSFATNGEITKKN